jgi:hypothetical protein
MRVIVAVGPLEPKTTDAPPIWKPWAATET